MKEQIARIKGSATSEIKNCKTLQELNDVRVKYLGKKGELTAVLKGMKDLSAEERPVIGALVTEVRDGLESKIKESEIALEEQALNEKLETEKIDKINLVGVSIGAVLVQDFANKYPSKVSSLTCIGGYDNNNFDKDLQKGNTKQQMKMILKAMFSIKAFAEDNKKISAYTNEAQEKFYQMNLGFKKSSFRYLATLCKLVNKYKTQKRDYPLLIGVGEYDNDMAKKASITWHKSEPDSEYMEFSGAGHIVNMDTPEQFNKILKKVIR